MLFVSRSCPGPSAPGTDITIYITPSSGWMTSMMAIYDTMQFIQPDI